MGYETLEPCGTQIPICCTKFVAGCGPELAKMYMGKSGTRDSEILDHWYLVTLRRLMCIMHSRRSGEWLVDMAMRVIVWLRGLIRCRDQRTWLLGLGFGSVGGFLIARRPGPDLHATCHLTCATSPQFSLIGGEFDGAKTVRLK